MADFMMCKSVTCPIRRACRRYTATPSKYNQYYFDIDVYNHVEDNCEYLYRVDFDLSVYKKDAKIIFVPE
jgi:hypothetical protein